MFELDLTVFLERTLHEAERALTLLSILSFLFLCIALIAKGRRVFYDMREAWPETQTNLILHVVVLFIVTPLLTPFLVLMEMTLQAEGLTLFTVAQWEALPAALVVFLCLFLGDMVGYFRHRLEHWSVIWPAHAVHHSDTRMTWYTLFRLHPVNYATTAIIDGFLMALLGFPVWAMVVFYATRTVYGAFIHIDLPWTYGPLGRIFVSPAMHRWHHVLEGPGVGRNFATVFSVYDQACGTFYLPGPCKTDLGVPEDMGHGAIGQLWHPFKVWGRALVGRGRVDGTPAE